MTSLPTEAQAPALILGSECHMYLIFPFCLCTSRVCGVAIYTCAIKFGLFLLLICLMSSWLLDQMKEPRKVEENFFLPYTCYKLPFDSASVNWLGVRPAESCLMLRGKEGSRRDRGCPQTARLCLEEGQEGEVHGTGRSNITRPPGLITKETKRFRVMAHFLWSVNRNIRLFCLSFLGWQRLFLILDLEFLTEAVFLYGRVGLGSLILRTSVGCGYDETLLMNQT